MQHLQPNATLQGGKYRIERVLGQGGFGITYLAVQTSLNRYVAIKELFIGGSGQAINDRRGNQVVVTNSANQASFNQQKEKFKKEALRLANLNHPNLVKVHEFFEDNGTAYYVMDYIEGESLRTKLNREGCLSESLVLKYMQQLLPALDTAHRQSIWHLDIKPENILVDRNGHITLIDFGASKHIEPNSTLTTSLVLAYTPGYCPPELLDLSNENPEYYIQAIKDIGPWTDIYALGATMYNLLSDYLPPSKRRLEKEGRNAFVYPNNVSSSTQDLIIWMMKPSKEDRPQSSVDIQRLQNQIQEEDEKTLFTNNQNVNNDYLYHTKKLLERIYSHNYDGVYGFSEGLANVKREGLNGFIDTEGKEVIPCIYDNVDEFSEGLAAVEKNGAWGFVDTEGKEVIPCIYDNVDEFSEGLAAIEKNGAWGYINKRGKDVIPCIFSIAGSFSEGYSSVRKDGFFGVIDKNGKEILPFLFDNVGPFIEGVMYISKAWKYGFINGKGDEIIPCVYDEVGSFNNGFAPVRNRFKWGMINKKGKEIVPCNYEEIEYCVEHLVKVKKDGKVGLINDRGLEIVSCIYDYIGDFFDNIAVVRKEWEYGYIDKSGHEVITCRFDFANDFNNGFAIIKKGKRFGRIDKNGNTYFAR
ncbi:MAG: WG repeat-containing protein [Prevotella sp.]|nr:WG repeat-containing protein [Prevotella sp.]